LVRGAGEEYVMARDVEGTKRKILEAAAEEFVAFGPDGTTMEKIARRAGVNKERVYNYYGSKVELFSVVLGDHLARGTGSVPLDATDADAIGEFAGRVYDYNRKNPQFVRLLLWEALSFTDDVPDEDGRGAVYAERTASITAGQASGKVGSALAPEALHFLLLAIAGYWAALPQVARMITSASDDNGDEADRRRAHVVEAARRLAAPA
jgi:AcrR family transcriptional regulator